MPPRPNSNDDDDDDDDETKQQLGWGARISQNIGKAKKGYEQLVHAVIRPPRAKYRMSDLGPAEFTFLNQRFTREDVELESPNLVFPEHLEHHPEEDEEEDAPPLKLKLQLSIWTRKEENAENNDATEETNGAAEEINDKKKTMVVYLHGNASARVEVLSNLSFLLAQGVHGVVSLDFTGSGKSDGPYVSLGYYERYDLECVLQYLQQTHGNVDIVLWGRSMGASTALMHASQKTQDNILRSQDETHSTILLKGLICDSPFCSLTILCEELVEKAREQGIVVPGVLVSVAISMIARSVDHHAHFDIREIAPIDHAPTISVPALFVCGADDDFIPPHHSESLLHAYQSGVSTNLFMVPGGHNDPRPEVVFAGVQQFLYHRLGLTTEMALKVPKGIEKFLHKCPPWSFQQKEIFQAHATTSAKNSTTVKVEDLGMTKERQDDIQNKLHMMLGQDG